jgi:hypothetical protein
MLCYFDAPVQNGIAKDCTRIALTTRLSLHRHSRKAPAAVQIPGWSCFSSDCITSDSQGILIHAACSLILSYRKYIHVRTCTYIHTYLRIHIHTCTHTCAYLYIHAYTHTHVHTYTHTYIRTYINCTTLHCIALHYITLHYTHT